MEVAVSERKTPPLRWWVWSPWMRWTFGVVLPAICFAVALTDAAFIDPFMGPRASVLVYAFLSALAMAVASLRPRRGGLFSGVLGGALAAGWLFALIYTVFFVPLYAIALLIPFPGWLALGPVLAFYVYFRAMVEELESGFQGRGLAFGLAVLLGALAPMSAALATYTGLERLERRVVATYVEPDDAPASTALQRWRGLAWLHDWPQLAAIQRRGFGQGDGPGVRAGRTWTDLTGQPEHRLNPSFD